MAGGLARGLEAGPRGRVWEYGLGIKDSTPDRRVIFVGGDGWPVERIRGRWATNAIRLLLHTRGVVIGRAATRRYR